jgi:hypothetical protein
MASIASPIGPTIDVVARTVSRSVISGGGAATVIRSQNLERDLEIVKTENTQQTQEISGLLGTVNNLKSEVEKVKRGGALVAQLRASLVNVERNLAVKTQEISGLLGTVNNLKSEVENSKKGGALAIQPQASLVNVERNLAVKTQEISGLLGTANNLKSEVENVRRSGALAIQLQSSLVNVERKLAIQDTQNSQQTQEISGLLGTVNNLKSEVENSKKGGALAIQPQASLVNVERNLAIQSTQNAQQTQEISGLLGTVNNLKSEVENSKKSSVLAIQPQASLVNVERNIEIQTTQNSQQTQEISTLRINVDSLKREVENVRRSGALVVQLQSSLVNLERNLAIQSIQNSQQTQEISALRSTVDDLRTETTTLNSGLASISNLVQQDSALEKQQAAAEAESERKLAETKVRMGKESQLEQKITNALVKPVQALQQKVTNIFGRIGEALTALFAGWLTNQGIEALKAASEGNKEKLEEIKDNVLKGIGDAIKVFTAIRTGFDLIIKTITGVTGRIAGFVTRLALAPVKALTNVLRGAPLLQNVFPGPKKPGGGGGGPGIFGFAAAAIESFMNAKNGEYVDAAMAALTVLGPGKIIKGLAALGFGLDNVIEVFGGNLFGKNPNYERKAKEIAAEAKKQQKEQNPKEEATSTTAAKVTSASTAQTPLMGDKKDEKSETDPKNMTPGPVPGSANIQPTSDAGSSPVASAAAPATSTPATSMAPQASELSLNNPPGALVTGQRPDKALNSEQFKAATQAREEAKVKGLSGKELEIYVANAAMNAKPSDTNVSSLAQVQPLPKPTQNVGELTEPAPNVVMMPSGQSNTQQSSMSQAPTNGTDTPLISSSNPDNFYVLYSQLNYNVVV